MLFVMTAAVACAYAPPADTVIVEGRILLTSSRPLDTFPWRGGVPLRSEYPTDAMSDAREISAIWEVRDSRLYLIAASAYEFGPLAPLHSLGLRELMPGRVQDGRVLADWYTGEFSVLEFERIEKSLQVVPSKATAAPKPVIRRYRIVAGRILGPVPEDNPRH